MTPFEQGMADRGAAMARGELPSRDALDRAAAIIAAVKAPDEALAYLEAAEWHDALAKGRRHWSERFSEHELPAGGSLTTAAIDRAREIADELRDRLLTGSESSYPAAS